MKARITKLVCPSCEGTGKFSLFGTFPCMWCEGLKRVDTTTAKRYADNIWTLAGGGYLAGDHDIKEKNEMEDRAHLVYSLIEEKPPWDACHFS